MERVTMFSLATAALTTSGPTASSSSWRPAACRSATMIETSFPAAPCWKTCPTASQESQKVLLVLSPEFVRSRWCLLEANMSLFRDCLERKPIVPVLLEPGVSVPLHLCHLTYLEASDPDFKNKLLKVLCTPNQQLQGSTVLPFHPPSIYNGKALQPLDAVNEDSVSKWDCGQFSDMEIPDQRA
ncbi:hypothetical protein KUCAC02_035133 [Chaenocephalus aceratus]|nr:hypothetical protein KUCAC02_035133 [Chaenocephalus aceratus]